jgi:hypothetical protein
MKKIALAFGTVLCLMTLMINCSNNNQVNAAGRNDFPYTYTTSSTKGDFAEWTFDGTDVRGTWQSLDSTGQVNFTNNIQATCPTYTAVYNYYTCTVNTAASTCTEGPGAANCSNFSSLNIQLIESPGSSISVLAANGSTSQLFTGFNQDTSCGNNLTGDYVFIRSGLGQTKLYGLQRVDNGFVSTVIAEFGLKASGPSAAVTVQYLSENASSSGSAVYSDGGCINGLRVRTLSGVTGRLLTTADGLMVNDKTSLQAGAIAVKTSAVANPVSLQNKTLSGFMFTDSGLIKYVKITTGSAAGNIVAITSADFNGTGVSGLDIRTLSETSTVTAAPAYPNFTSAPDPSPISIFSYSANSLVPSYSNPGSFTGTYRIDGFLTNDRILFTATVDRSKLMLYGVGYSWKLTTDTPPPGATYPANGYYSSSSLVLFEK